MMPWRPNCSLLKMRAPYVYELDQCSKGDRRGGQDLKCFISRNPVQLEGKLFHFNMYIIYLLGSA